MITHAILDCLSVPVWRACLFGEKDRGLFAHAILDCLAVPVWRACLFGEKNMG